MNIIMQLSIANYFNLALSYSRKPKSYNDIRMVDGVLHSIFKDAALAKSLLLDDCAWINYLDDTFFYKMPKENSENYLRLSGYRSDAVMGFLIFLFI